MTAREIFDQILKQRGISDVDSFINPSYESLADPFLLADMDKAVKRLQAAHKKGETIAVYGDYDVDGMTATTLLADALAQFGFMVETFIPDRFVDGYGLSERGIDELKSKGVSLLLTVDTGSLSHDHVAYAKKHGVNVIVTDHHTVGVTLPDAVAVINPKRPDSKYPFKDLAGVGVAFTLVRALQTKLDGLPAGQEKWLLDLVALGTVCDIVPLTGENRVLVYFGLVVMSKTNRVGLHALAEASASDLAEVSTYALGWRFGPRLNASGRLTHAKLSMDLLSAEDRQLARQLASELDTLNTERRQIQNDIYKQARAQAEEYLDSPVLILAGEGWNHGTVGVVASRLSEELGKPTFVLEVQDGTTKGSARSFGDFHLANAIDSVRDTIETGGGHAAAAGVTLPSEKLDEFRTGINDYYKSLKLKDQAKHLEVSPDVVLKDFNGLDDELIELMSKLEPYGTAHAQPIFAVEPVTLSEWRAVGSDMSHAKAKLVDSSGVTRDSIGFRLADKMPKPGASIRPLFTLEYNEWNGTRSIQHKLLDVTVL